MIGEKVHYIDPAYNEHTGKHRASCAVPANFITSIPINRSIGWQMTERQRHVTCKNCLKEIEKHFDRDGGWWGGEHGEAK